MTTVKSIDGTSIRCNCCPNNKKLAELHPDRSMLEIRSRQHGTIHYTQINAIEIIESLAGTVGMGGVLQWIRSQEWTT